MKKSDVDLVNSVARIKNRVAVKKYYYEELPKEIRALAFTVSNLETLRQIEMVKRSLENAIDKGESFQTWKDNLDREVVENLSRARLETVYRTNVNNVYNQSTRYNAMTSRVTPYLMYTAIGDSRTRPEHMQLDGTVKRADSEFWLTHTPPLGFNCVASRQIVSGDFDKAFRSSYKGMMIGIKLKSKKSILGITPNHPVMTDLGFVFAKDLKSGDKLVVNNREIKGLNLSVEKHNYNLIAKAGDRFKSMLTNRLGFSKGTAFNFHGDIKFMDKQVDVVAGHSSLSSNIELRKPTGNLLFILSHYAAKFLLLSVVGKCSAIKLYSRSIKNLFNHGSGDSDRFRNISSAFKFMFIEMLTPFLDLGNILSEKLLRRNISPCNSTVVQPPVDRISTDPELSAKFKNAQSSIVGLDEVVQVYSYPYFGFVYDFESVHGLVVVDGIVTSNCRCGVVPMTKEDAEEIGISRRANDSFPKPEEGFGSKKMGDVLSGVNREAERAISEISNKQMRSKFREAQENVQGLVDIWFEGKKNIFE